VIAFSPGRKEAQLMPGQGRDEAQSVPEEEPSVGKPDESMNEEEKVLAGRTDANMPSLLTQDVPGG
jgi:hypothetical protein